MSLSPIWDHFADLIDPPEDPDAWQPLPHQIPPDGLDWLTWLLFGGRGTGKTDGAAHYFDAHMSGPACDPRLPGGHRIAIIGPTLGDVIDSCITGPSGIKAHNPNVRMTSKAGGTYVYWPNGAEAKLFGAFTPDDVERLRAGGNRCAAWVEELAAWRQLEAAWKQMRFGLRLGKHPHVIGSTTPKPRKFLIDLVHDSKTRVTHAKTADNPYLDEDVRKQLYADYQGTRLGRQELEGELLTDVPGAIATLDELDIGRMLEGLEKYDRIIVSLDPAVTNTEDSDETGISVSARRANEVYQLADLSVKLDVSDWARRAIEAAIEWSAGMVLYESNQGNDTIGELLKQAMIELGLSPYKITVKKVPAQLSKFDRALPLQQAIQQGRFHLVGSFPKLEEQLTTWTMEDKSAKSPDRMDAAVHGFRELMGLSVGKGRTMGRQISAARIG